VSNNPDELAVVVVCPPIANVFVASPKQATPVLATFNDDVVDYTMIPAVDHIFEFAINPLLYPPNTSEFVDVPVSACWLLIPVSAFVVTYIEPLYFSVDDIVVLPVCPPAHIAEEVVPQPEL